jgi:hypothetical protein
MLAYVRRWDISVRHKGKSGRVPGNSVGHFQWRFNMRAHCCERRLLSSHVSI